MMILDNPFMVNALLISVIISVVCGVIGTYVVIKRISFLTGSISHASFGGIGLGYYLGINPLLSALGFGVLCAMVMGSIKLRFKESEDALIGLIWAVGMAIGILLIHLTPGYASDLMTYLFGNILLTSLSDLLFLGGLAFVILVILRLFYCHFQAITFDESYATLMNLPVYRLWMLFLVLLTMAIIMLIKVVGIILVIALLTIPASTARRWHSHMGKLMVTSTLLCLAALIGGLLLSYQTDLPAGPLIIGFSTFFYGVSLLYSCRNLS